MGLGDAYDT